MSSFFAESKKVKTQAIQIADGQETRHTFGNSRCRVFTAGRFVLSTSTVFPWYASTCNLSSLGQPAPNARDFTPKGISRLCEGKGTP
jgi:hypothetical protein